MRLSARCEPRAPAPQSVSHDPPRRSLPWRTSAARALRPTGSFWPSVCVHEPTEPSWQLSSFTTNRAELLKVLEKQRPRVVVIEACALCGWVRDQCEDTECAAKSPTRRARPRSLPPHDYEHRVRRPNIALAVRAEHGESVVARPQILDGEFGRPLRQFAHLLRPVVQFQLFPAGELGIVH